MQNNLIIIFPPQQQTIPPTFPPCQINSLTVFYYKIISFQKIATEHDKVTNQKIKLNLHIEVGYTQPTLRNEYQGQEIESETNLVS